jgi:sugar/nucleoside kinase (ribokinase family)
MPDTLTPAEVVVAGHICVDVIPTFDQPVTLAELLVPGKLNRVGPAVTSTGGVVSNTGLALHRLGVPVRLMGKVGGGLFGQAAIALLEAQGAHLADGMIVAPDEPASYTLVINPPGVDRIFLHDPGPNNTFGAADVDLERVRGARIFHFGYPPAMARMHADGGTELAALMQAVRAAGVTTSLDMSQPNPGLGVDWRALLGNVLPHVDLFGPNIDETLYMLDPARSELLRRGELAVDGALLREVSGALLGMGAAVVLLKLGDLGLYLRTSPDAERIRNTGPGGPANVEKWTGRELMTPCFQAAVAGTTGSGDCTVAGFLAAILRGLSAEDAIIAGVAVGGCSVERPDATSGVPRWEEVAARVAAGWAHYPLAVALPGWREIGPGLWASPDDEGGARGG